MHRSGLPRLAVLCSLACLLVSVFLSAAVGQTHEHGSSSPEKIKPPRIFLDKSPRIVQYQLDRLNNARLLLVERSDDDPKYLPVHLTIFKRPGIARQDRDNALAAICEIKQSQPVDEILEILGDINAGQRSDQQLARQLTKQLLDQSATGLVRALDALRKAASSESELLRTAGLAGLIAAGNSDVAKSLATASEASKVSLLRAIPLIPDRTARNGLRPMVTTYLTTDSKPIIQKTALEALRSISLDPAQTFRLAADFVDNKTTRRSAVRVLLDVPRNFRDAATATTLVQFLVELAENTPPDQRTTAEFLESMQLANQLLSIVSQDQSREFRQRLNDVVVRVILIHTVEEEMRYDIPWFAVEAGSDVQVVLKNEDLMPHNLVITSPGALKEVALAGSGLGPKIGESGKQYVPVSPDVLQATRMVPSGQQDVLTFKAPIEPGEYPYVCTFPGHWMRMYGVMVVVDDLDAFERNPVEPKDPVGSDRAFVKSWLPDDLDGKYETGLKGRNAEIGKKLFVEATCAQCHVVAGDGKAVGPELTDVWRRWKGDSKGIFREIVEPSHKIEPKYVVRKIITIDGEVISGIVTAEDKKTLSILPDPESAEATIIPQDDVEEMMTSSVSIMPKGLLDRYTEDEIFEILGYLQGSAPPDGD